METFQHQWKDRFKTSRRRGSCQPKIDALLDLLKEVQEEEDAFMILNEITVLTEWRPPPTFREDAPRIIDALTIFAPRFSGRLGAEAYIEEIQEKCTQLDPGYTL